MSISQEELQKIAKNLSKIPGNNPALLENITDILAYMELLNEVDTTWVVPTVSVVQEIASLREDQLDTNKIASKDLLDCSHQKVVANHIVLPNIMK